MKNSTSALVLAAVLLAGFGTGWVLKPSRVEENKVQAPPIPATAVAAAPVVMRRSGPSVVILTMRPRPMLPAGHGAFPYNPASPPPTGEPATITLQPSPDELPDLLCEKVADLYRAYREALKAANNCRMFQGLSFLGGVWQRQRLVDMQAAARAKSWDMHAIAVDIRYQASAYPAVTKVAGDVLDLHERRCALFDAWEDFADFSLEHRPSEWTAAGVKERSVWHRQKTQEAQQDLNIAEFRVDPEMSMLWAKCAALLTRRGHPPKAVS